ncbi:MAG: hypothetical protein KDD28_21090, partial [Phaeodactylibacter sp.]|nr:hypothetical protein [Phaeodactylibacter sp.]
INCPFWLVLFAPCCVAHHSGSFGYPHSSRLAWHKNYRAIIEHFILSSCLNGYPVLATARPGKIVKLLGLPYTFSAPLHTTHG